jgi:hypothetical protein
MARGGTWEGSLEVHKKQGRSRVKGTREGKLDDVNAGGSLRDLLS